MESLARDSSRSGKLEFVIAGDIRSRHDAIMMISEAVLDEIRRDDLAIAQTLEKTTRRASYGDGDHFLRSRAPPNSPSIHPMNDCTSGHGSKFVADDHFTDEENEVPGFLPHETKRLFSLGASPIIKGDISDDTMATEMVRSDREETAATTQTSLALLDLLPDVPKDIMRICWRYQHLDDEQLESMRQYMIAKAFGWREKILEENTPSV